ncbi:hypothetical protein EPI10_015927 [Gossypium australe]|uniref:Uncharacterized protein n=1 Tax=Gossypium australe TaxID=47621 RepID=A0A5B6VM97_9ROSI|nr:hypothetical protein EPI10_015927 [Gossypium australe]
MKDSKTVNEYFDQLPRIAKKLRLLGFEFPNSRLVQKFLSVKGYVDKIDECFASIRVHWLRKHSTIKEERERNMKRTRREYQNMILQLQINEQNLISLLVNTMKERVIHFSNTGESQTINVKSVKRWGIIKEFAKAILNKRLSHN